MRMQPPPFPTGWPWPRAPRSISSGSPCQRVPDISKMGDLSLKGQHPGKFRGEKPFNSPPPAVGPGGWGLFATLMEASWPPVGQPVRQGIYRKGIRWAVLAEVPGAESGPSWLGVLSPPLGTHRPPERPARRWSTGGWGRGEGRAANKLTDSRNYEDFHTQKKQGVFCLKS